MIAQHSSRYFIFRMAFIAAMIALGFGEVRVSIAGFSSSDPEPRCPSDSPPGVIHALLIGVGQYPQLPERANLEGPSNDLTLLSQTLVNKGVKPENIKILLDSQSTVKNILASLDDLIKGIPCGDQVLIHYSGPSRKNALFSFDTRIESGRGAEFDGIITGDELRNKIVDLKNLHFPTLVSIDANYAASLKLESLVETRGNIAILHPATEMTVEMRLPRGKPERKSYGVFSWCLAQSLAEIPGSVKVSELANNMSRCLTGDIFNPLSFAATNWDMTLNFPSTPSNTNSKLIEFNNLPPEQRGFRLSEQSRFRLEGHIQGPDKPLATLINKDIVEVNNGRFSHDVTLETGRNEITVTALFANGQLAQRSVVIDYQGNIEALRGQGRLIALLIGNQNYQRGWTPLKTPIADVRTLAQVLREQYGFTTKLAVGKQDLDLELIDADRSQIGRTLNQLTKELRESDRLLVFYAGHGAQGSDTSFWIPVDADRDDDTTWFSGEELIRQLRKIPARQVLVIADSCYAGSLIRERDPESPPKNEDERLKYLERMSGNPVRSYIASGGKEPVLDEGGSGHSLFANVLLKALRQPPHPSFTAGELYQNFVEAVVGRSEQTPVSAILRRAFPKEDFSAFGDFVFMKLPDRHD
ncbi:MAG: caspase family protein [Candidatus Contendobacter sp.]|nr:caspase family protein [Candidatus Contendobacter sp.]